MRGGGWFGRVKSVVLAIIYAVFTVAGVGLAVRATEPRDRLIAIATAIFFGVGGVVYFSRDVLARGLRAQPSPTLHVGGARTELDRLELFASPQRLLFIGGAVVFFAAAATLGFALGPGIEGVLVGGASLVFVAAGIVMFVAIARTGPLIVFDRYELRYRTPLRPHLSVRYDDLAGGVVVATMSGEVCALALVDQDAFLTTRSPATRRDHLKAERAYGFPVVLPALVGPNAEQLLQLVAQYARWTEGAAEFGRLPDEPETLVALPPFEDGLPL